MAMFRWEKLESPTLDEVVHAGVLASGLRVYFCPKPGFRKRYASYATLYGSIDREFVEAGGERVSVPDGIAHFLEHTLFETERGNVSDLFARNGAYSNAATSFTTTTYLFAASELFYENLALLLWFVENPCFRAEKVEKERGIIEQEIRGYDDSPDWVSYRTLLEGLFREHPIRIDIAGTAESIAKIDVPALERCYRSFYHPRNMSLFVVGDLDPAELGDFIESHSRGPVEASTVRERVFPDEPHGVAKGDAELQMEVALPKLFLGFKETGVPVTGEEYVRRELVSDMAVELLFGRGSDAFRDLYDRQLVLDDFSASYGAAAGIGYAMIGGDAPDPVRLRSALAETIESLCRRGLEDEDFEREKRRFIGSFIRGFNSLEFIANYYTYYRFHDFDLFGTVDLLHGVTKVELEDRLQALLDPDAASWVTVVPR